MGVHYVCDVPVVPQDDVGNHVTDALEPGDHSGDLRRLVWPDSTVGQKWQWARFDRDILPGPELPRGPARS